MSKPLDSVIALARFSLNSEQQVLAAELLAAESDWSLWLRQIELHALAGFAAQHITQYKLPVPNTMLLKLRALNLRHRLASEARYEALQQIDTIFKQHDIPYLGLKGVCLMPMIYQYAELRPMRDMDLLIPIEMEQKAVRCMREIGFTIPDQQPTKYMKNMHQLPNATKTVNGFKVSVELHRDGYTRETRGHLPFPASTDRLQDVAWQDLRIKAFNDLQMLDQVSRHTESMHGGALLKLINVMDVIGLAEYIRAKGDWQQLNREVPDVVSTLRCLHLYTPLPEALCKVIESLPKKPVTGVGEIAMSLRASIAAKNIPFKKRFKQLLSPSNWWLHLYYNVHPDKSLLWVKAVRHPARIVGWLFTRAYSRVLGG